MKASNTAHAVEHGHLGLARQLSRRACRVCGCTDARACAGGCAWVDEDTCSACDPAPRAGDQVTVGIETREVEGVKHGRVYYSWPGKIAVRSLPLSAWQRWARGPLD